jgi:hypothetical protein
MSKYARINSLTKKVDTVIISNVTHIKKLPDYDLWVETSVELTKKIAGIGDTYDVDNNNFKSPQPYASWTFNNTSWNWEAPTAMPSQTGDEVYYWDEDAYQADNTTGWPIRS